jgi:hypothetical protein
VHLDGEGVGAHGCQPGVGEGVGDRGSDGLQRWYVAGGGQLVVHPAGEDLLVATARGGTVDQAGGASEDAGGGKAPGAGGG